jgi:hypothetical protein
MEGPVSPVLIYRIAEFVRFDRRSSFARTRAGPMPPADGALGGKAHPVKKISQSAPWRIDPD